MPDEAGAIGHYAIGPGTFVGYERADVAIDVSGRVVRACKKH